MWNRCAVIVLATLGFGCGDDNGDNGDNGSSGTDTTSSTSSTGGTGSGGASGGASTASSSGSTDGTSTSSGGSSSTTSGGPPTDGGGATGSGSGGSSGGGTGGVDPGDAQPYDYIVHLQDDVDMATLQQVADTVQIWSNTLWEISEGQQYMRTVTIRDAQPGEDSDIDVLIGAGDIDQTGSSLCGGATACVTGGRNGRIIKVGGEVWPLVFGHEHGHYEFSVDEEYDNPVCPNCVMGRGNQGPAAQYCDASNHTPNAQEHYPDGYESDCWDIIHIYYQPDWQHPNSAYVPDSLPPLAQFTLEDS